MTVTVERSAPVVQRLPLSRLGTGSQSLGTFAVHGNLRVRATCVGTGKIKVSVKGPGGFAIGPVPCQGNDKVALDAGSNDNGRAEITVQAPAHMKWWLDAVDRQPNF